MLNSIDPHESNNAGEDSHGSGHPPAFDDINLQLTHRKTCEDYNSPRLRYHPRKHLHHQPPLWISTDSTFFITINCAARSENILTVPSTAKCVLTSAQHYQDIGKWYIGLMLLMPDHLHALLCFPQAEILEEVISNWMKYIARTLAVVWQRDFFEHRIRDEVSLREKAEYIRQNPVRKGLIADPDKWPYAISNPLW